MIGPAGMNTIDAANLLKAEPAPLIVELTVEASTETGSSIGLSVTAGVGQMSRLRIIA
jgi:hypothetical protein